LNQDSLLFLAVFAVWILLALVYAVVPLFAMPGYAAVWGYGSLVFLGLSIVTTVAARRRRRAKL
jgi:hypothetical protein